jgi:hypothetical protein
MIEGTNQYKIDCLCVHRRVLARAKARTTILDTLVVDYRWFGRTPTAGAPGRGLRRNHDQELYGF